MRISLGDAIDRLITVSNRIFHNEQFVGEEQQKAAPDLERVGRLALEIRALNAERIALRNHINALGDPLSFADVKVLHASQRPR